MGKAIKVENLSKAYQIGEFSTGTLSRDIERWWALSRGKEDPFLKIGETNVHSSKGESNVVWSLKNLNFEVEKGEVLGIIGKNGAGKSTLLKVLSQVTTPTTGTIKMKGRVASLLEVGTGFHPELTGRENIYLNGAILGMQKVEVKKKFDEIVDFSGVERYIDTPVKRYSSGMYVRLAFAVAAHLESEILIVDEVLAVGDAEFQKKAIGKMQDASKGGDRTVLFVSHNMVSVNSLCSRAVLLENGKLVLDSDTSRVVDKYLQTSSSMNVSEFVNSDDTNYNFFIRRAKLLSLKNGKPIYDLDDEISLEVQYEVRNKVIGGVVTLELCDAKSNTIYLSFDSDQSPELLEERNKGVYKVKIVLPRKILKPGEYYISLGTGIANQSKLSYFKSCLSFEVVPTKIYSSFLSYDSRRVGLIRSDICWELLS